jgi:hypothetical protein
MKTNYLWPLSLLFLLWATTCSAQTKLHPKEEYKLVASANTITMARGQQDSVKLTVLRSKSFKTGKALVSVNSPSGAGLNVRVEQVPGEVDEYMVYLTTTTDARTGEYTFIPTCTLRNKQKGIILKLTIN